MYEVRQEARSSRRRNAPSFLAPIIFLDVPEDESEPSKEVWRLLVGDLTVQRVECRLIKLWVTDVIVKNRAPVRAAVAHRILFCRAVPKHRGGLACSRHLRNTNCRRLRILPACSIARRYGTDQGETGNTFWMKHCIARRYAPKVRKSHEGKPARADMLPDAVDVLHFQIETELRRV